MAQISVNSVEVTDGGFAPNSIAGTITLTGSTIKTIGTGGDITFNRPVVLSSSGIITVDTSANDDNIMFHKANVSNTKCMKQRKSYLHWRPNLHNMKHIMSARKYRLRLASRVLRED